MLSLVDALSILLKMGIGSTKGSSSDSDISLEGGKNPIPGLPKVYEAGREGLYGKTNPDLGYSFAKPELCEGDSTQSKVESGFDNVICAIRSTTNKILTNDNKNRFDDDSDEEASDIISNLKCQFAKNIEDQAKTLKQSLGRILNTLGDEIRINIANVSSVQREALIQLLNGAAGVTPEILAQILNIVNLTNSSSLVVSGIVDPPVTGAIEAVNGTINADTKFKISTLASLASSLKELLCDDNSSGNGLLNCLNREQTIDELRRLITAVECIKQDILSDICKEQSTSKISDNSIIYQYSELYNAVDSIPSRGYTHKRWAPAMRGLY
ncbi:hypothetical protein PAEPH01_0152 [Pancytospora epiphaga]|nr:hypothetical protein PAEPH01_0152 [Pancytospora epiphaga]